MGESGMLEQLKEQLNKRVRIAFSNGEVVVADVFLVLDDEGAVVFDLVSSNEPAKYVKSDKPPHILARIADITSCEPERSGCSEEAGSEHGGP